MQEIQAISCIFGRGDGDRTHDLSVPNAARYQLRYASIFRKLIHYNKVIYKSQTFLTCYINNFSKNVIL